MKKQVQVEKCNFCAGEGCIGKSVQEWEPWEGDYCLTTRLVVCTFCDGYGKVVTAKSDLKLGGDGEHSQVRST